MATLPELVVLPRPGLETAYLGFGAGKSLSQTGVRRAFAQALDTAAIVRDAFPPGSAPATHTHALRRPGRLRGNPVVRVQRAGGVRRAGRREVRHEGAPHPPRARRSAAGPARPAPRRPPPSGTSWRRASGVGVEIDVMPASELAAAVAEGTLDGLYLGGVRSSLADPSGFLEPLFGETATGTAADARQGRPRGAHRRRPGDQPPPPARRPSPPPTTRSGPRRRSCRSRMPGPRSPTGRT